MLEALRDPLWQFIGAIFTILSVGVIIIIFFIQRYRKSLSYDIISATSILTNQEELKGRLIIQLDGKIVPNVHIIILKLMNDGNVPIIVSDFNIPITISMGSKTQILSAEVIETNPENIDASVKIESNNLILKPLLLNGKDTITLKVLTQNFENIVNVGGRIVGIKSIEKTKEPKLPFILICIAAVIVIVGMSIGLYYKRDDITGTSLVIGYILLIPGMLLSKQIRKRMVEITKISFLGLEFTRR